MNTEKINYVKILTKLEKIEKKLSKEENALEDYISEYEAKKLLKRETTWFWNLRRKGFPYTKIGAENYYLKKDFVKLLEDNMQGEWYGKAI